jgi:sRNA-binding regulator protein Hfq
MRIFLYVGIKLDKIIESYKAFTCSIRKKSFLFDNSIVFYLKFAVVSTSKAQYAKKIHTAWFFQF